MSATALLQTSQHKHCHIGYLIVATRILVSKVRTCVEYSTRVTVVLRFDTCYHMSNTYMPISKDGCILNIPKVEYCES